MLEATSSLQQASPVTGAPRETKEAPPLTSGTGVVKSTGNLLPLPREVLTAPTEEQVAPATKPRRPRDLIRGQSLRLRVFAALALVSVFSAVATTLLADVPSVRGALPGLVLALPGIAGAVVLALLLTPKILQPVGALKQTIERMQAGDASTRSLMDPRDEVGAIAAAFDALSARAQALIGDLESRRIALEHDIIQLFVELSRATNGDLTVRPTVSEGSLGAVAESISALLERFNEIIHSIQATAREVSGSTRNVAATVQDVSREARKQALTLTHGSEGVGALAASASLVSQRTESAMEASSRALDTMRQGYHAVFGLNETMRTTSDTTRRAARQVKTLGESMQLMTQALTLAQRNTEELHIVAGNAAIEAARHSDSGGVFRRVADSIEALAAQSEIALGQIEEVAERNQRETAAIVETIENVSTRVDEGVRDARAAAEAFETLGGVLREAVDLNRFIAGASVEQARQAHELAIMMGVLNGVSEETSRIMAAAADAADHLRAVSDQLHNSVSMLTVH